MRFRAGLVIGLAAGYYLGAKAGRRRYEQIERMLTRVKRSAAFDAASDKAKAAVDAGLGRARGFLDTRPDRGAAYRPSEPAARVGRWAPAGGDADPVP
jgi:hypothetical protein